MKKLLERKMLTAAIKRIKRLKKKRKRRKSSLKFQ